MSSLRTNLKNFLLTATVEEAEAEYQLSVDRGDLERASIIRDLIDSGWIES